MKGGELKEGCQHIVSMRVVHMAVTGIIYKYMCAIVYAWLWITDI